MSSTKAHLTRPEGEPPEWAAHISMFMKSLRLSQAGLAAKLNVTQQAVNNWLKGRREPSAEIYYRMSRLNAVAPEAEPLIMRARAISKGQFPPRDDAKGKRPVEASIESTIIPLLKSGAALSGKIAEEDIEQLMPFPGFFSANAVGDVFCFRASDGAMSPIIEPGCIVAIDTGLVDPSLMRNEMVAAFDPDGSLTVRWLRRSGSSAYLAPHNVMRDNPPVVIADNGTSIDGWRLAGKIIWWVGTAI